MPKVKIGSREFNLPKNRIVRISLGAVLIIGGIVGFLPILGFWMVPLGMVVLADDVPVIHRINLWFGRKIKLIWKKGKEEIKEEIQKHKHK